MDTQSPLVLNITCGSQCDHLSLSNRDFVIYLHLMLCEVFFSHVCCVCLFQGDSPFGKSDAYIKLEQLGEGSYATVYKGYSK